MKSIEHYIATAAPHNPLELISEVRGEFILPNEVFIVSEGLGIWGSLEDRERRRIRMAAQRERQNFYNQLNSK